MLLKSFACVLLFGLSLHAQTSHPANDHKVVVQDVKITGTRSIDTTELDEIAGTLTASPINNDDEAIKERLRFAFQDHGYFKSEIESVEVKTLDPLVRPILVAIEAAVSEGPQFQMGEVRFANNHAFTSEQLKAKFPFHKGERFNRSKIGKGLEAIRILYSQKGYIDFTPVPNTDIATDSVDITVDIDEGRQYHMGNLEFGGSANAADKLRTRWELESGQPFEQTYVEKFVQRNRTLLPATFDQQSAIKYARDCKNSTVNILIDLDPEHPAAPPRDVPCESNNSDKSSVQ
jgi:outer membrane protein assembly factor BamA